MKEAVQKYARDEFREDVWDELAAAMHYVASTSPTRAARTQLRRAADELDEERGTGGNRVYYLAVPPSGVPDDRRGARRAARPRGLDAADRREAVRPRPRLGARAERDAARSTSPSSEIFRIDHYLGKETVQNMLALRFANGIFEPIWNRQFIDHVQITVAESIGIEGRAGFYEPAGAIRDIFQNHLLQLLAITAMEPPIDFTAESVRNEKVKVLRSLHTPGPKSVVRGQYGRGFVEGVEVPGLPRGGGRRAGLDDRDVRRGEALRRQLALGRHAVLRAHGQAARAARDDDRDPVQARAAPAVRGGVVGRAAARTCCSSTCSRTRASRSRSARRCPGRA